MLLDRLNPETSREINHLVFANWTIEEVEAYLDYQDQLDQRAMEQEERRGGYGCQVLGGCILIWLRSLIYKPYIEPYFVKLITLSILN